MPIHGFWLPLYGAGFLRSSIQCILHPTLFVLNCRISEDVWDTIVVEREAEISDVHIAREAGCTIAGGSEHSDGGLECRTS
jgi:hypothetical protein